MPQRVTFDDTPQKRPKNGLSAARARAVPLTPGAGLPMDARDFARVQGIR